MEKRPGKGFRPILRPIPSATAKSPGASVNYFTCTLGESVENVAGLWDIQTVNDFIDHQAKHHSKDLAVGFPTVGDSSHDWNHEAFNFEELRNGSIGVANEISKIVSPKTTSKEPECVALLCPSSVDFLFAWLGLMRAGFAVLLIAPQCQPAAIAHLCKSCDASILFHDASLADLAFSAVSEPGSKVLAIELPWQVDKISVISLARSSQRLLPDLTERIGNSHEAAFIFHTSGTSTGLPKPITQSHYAACGVLPVLDGRDSATFTTTPLYHGGIADCFRAWASGALIWLFPAATVPITALNIKSCLSVVAKATSELSAPQVKYFSSVPYVLQMLAEDASGLRMLQDMEIVGVGGAALSPNVGDGLVESGVNLVSRFGSAECGFLLSSHRNYKADKDWQYLRLSAESRFLSFEQQDDNPGLYELVVRKGWPHIAKPNRDDGSFATSDLFEPHANIPGAWRYNCRSDSQITLISGKKFDPAPLEDYISSSSTLIREVVVFGSGRLQPGLIIICSEDASRLTHGSIEEKLWELLQEVNSKGQDHTRIARDMVIIMPSTEPPLQRSSKGTLLRGVTEKKFAAYMDKPLQEDSDATTEHIEEAVNADDIKGLVRSTVCDVLEGGDSISDEADFFAHGVDSASCYRIRSLLQRNLIHDGTQLPFNVVYDCGNINQLTQFMAEILNGDVKPQEDAQAEMIGLVNRLSKLNAKDSTVYKELPANPEQRIVILTGATGALGAQILDQLRNDCTVDQIICLVRAVDHFTARSRISASLVKRRKPALEIADDKIWCSPCKFSDPTGKLGISDMELSHIRRNATHIIHAAWAVNFSLPLKSFVDEHLSGLHHLFNLTLSCSQAVEFTFCSSTASVLAQNQHSNAIGEEISTNPLDAGAIGYSRSKWVAEGICAAAARQLQGRVNVLRLGQLTGDTENGVWNVSEAWPLMLSTIDVIHCLPELQEPLSWLPLDVAAKAVVEIALQDCKIEGNDTCNVYHLVNNSSETTWSDLLSWSKMNRATPFQVVSPKVWLEELSQYPKKHPAKNLLGLWTNAYAEDVQGTKKGISTTQRIFSTKKSEKRSVAMRGVVPVDQVLVDKIWAWLDDEIKAAKTQVYVSTNRFATE